MAGFFTAPGNEGNAYRREVIANLAGDAMRQMNPFRDSSPQPANTGATQQQPATLNIPGDNGQPATTGAATPALKQSAMSPAATALAGGMGQAQPAKTAPRFNPASSGLSSQDVATRPSHSPAPIAAEDHLRQNPHLAGQFQQKYGYIPNGITIQSGTAGQDGYGAATRTGALPQPGSTMRNLGLPDQPNALPVSVRSLAGLGSTVGTTRGDGFEFTGSADDAAKFFRKPLGGPAVSASPAARALAGPPPGQSYGDWLDGAAARYDQRVGGGSSTAPNVPQPPKYMTPEEGRATGIGWQGRRAKYETDMAAYQHAMGNQNAMDIARMNAQGVNDQNNLAMQRLLGDQQVNRSRIGTEDINQQKGQMEIESLRAIKAASDEYMKSPTPENERKYRALIGKFEREPQYGTVGRYDDTGMRIGEDLFNRQTGELVRRDDSDRLHPIPKDPNDLVTGRIYITKAGVGRWDGTHFDTRWYDRDNQQAQQQTPRPPAAPVQPSTGQLMP